MNKHLTNQIVLLKKAIQKGLDIGIVKDFDPETPCFIKSEQNRTQPFS